MKRRKIEKAFIKRMRAGGVTLLAHGIWELASRADIEEFLADSNRYIEQAKVREAQEYCHEKPL